MADREKVIKGLEVCLASDLSEDENPCAPCPYFFDEMCQIVMKKDALALLREQEPVAPHYKELAILGQWDTLPICGACGTIIGYSVKYCPHCGKEVDWNAEERHD